ncbi:MAG: hypothetical protein WAU01_13180 [Saprospiraceae bacterium]
MNIRNFAIVLSVLIGFNCSEKKLASLSEEEKSDIESMVQKEIDTLIMSVNTKDIDLYMRKMPDDFMIYDENGEIVTREKQREFALRDWSIIDTTINNLMTIDSIQYISKDSIFVYTYQKWERLMFQKDGVTIDTVITTQKHRELWKKKGKAWMGYDVKELGGEIFINGQKYVSN